MSTNPTQSSSSCSSTSSFTSEADYEVTENETTLTEQVKALTEIVRGHTDTINQSMLAYNAVNANNQVLSGRISFLEKEKESFSGRISFLENEGELAKAKLLILRTRIDELVAKNTSLNDQISKLEQEKSISQQNLESAEKDNENLRNKIIENEKEIAKLRDLPPSVVNPYDVEKITNLEVENARLSSKIKLLENDIKIKARIIEEQENEILGLKKLLETPAFDSYTAIMTKTYSEFEKLGKTKKNKMESDTKGINGRLLESQKICEKLKSLMGSSFSTFVNPNSNWLTWLCQVMHRKSITPQDLETLKLQLAEIKKTIPEAKIVVEQAEKEIAEYEKYIKLNDADLVSAMKFLEDLKKLFKLQQNELIKSKEEILSFKTIISVTEKDFNSTAKKANSPDYQERIAKWESDSKAAKEKIMPNAIALQPLNAAAQPDSLALKIGDVAQGVAMAVGSSVVNSIVRDAAVSAVGNVLNRV